MLFESAVIRYSIDIRSSEIRVRSCWHRLERATFQIWDQEENDSGVTRSIAEAVVTLSLAPHNNR
jgi:hypothetical protein